MGNGPLIAPLSETSARQRGAMAFTVTLPAAVLVTTLRAIRPVVWRGAVLVITAAGRMPTVVLLAAVLVLIQLLPYHAEERGHAGVVQMATIMRCVHEQFFQHCQRLVVGWRGLLPSCSRLLEIRCPL